MTAAERSAGWAGHRLGAFPHYSCEDGVCNSDSQQVWSNVSSEEAEDMQRRRDPAQEWVEGWHRGLGTLHEATSEALRNADESLARDAGDELATVTIYFEEHPFDFQRFRGLGRDPEARQPLLEARRNQLRGQHEKISALVRRLGGTVLSGAGVRNLLHAQVPIVAIEELVATSPVAGVELQHEGQAPLADGEDMRAALGLPTQRLGLPYDAGFGSTRSGGNEVRFGIIESDNSLNTSHVAWRDWSGSSAPSRVIDTDRCTWWFPGGDQCINSANTTANTHGTQVTWALMGSIEQNQDSGRTGASEQVQRSGIATEAEARYYSTDYVRHTAQALDEIWAADGVDIVNMSLGPGSYCKNDSYDGVRAAVQIATMTGVLVVAGAGNEGGTVSGCSVSSYGAFPDTLTVGGVINATSLEDLQDDPVWLNSGRGSVNVTLAGGKSVPTRFVDLLANARLHDYAAAGTNGYGTIPVDGTSYSTPQVAGVAGLVKHFIEERGGFGSLQDDPYAIRVMLSVMGDGSDKMNGGGQGACCTVSPHSGFGHLRFVDFDSDLGGTSGWGVKRMYVSQGQVFEFSVGGSGPESNAVNGWKFAALWDEDYYDGSAEIKFQLIDKCPAGGGEEVVQTATVHPLKARLRIKSGQVDSRLRGRCLHVRGTVEHANGTIPLYMADYYYSNDRIHHDQ